MAPKVSIESAELGSASKTVYDALLQRTYSKTTPREYILLYLLGHRSISVPQTELMYGSGHLKTRSIDQLIFRMMSGGLLEKGNLSSGSSRRETYYSITRNGIRSAADIFTSLFHKLLIEDKSFLRIYSAANPDARYTVEMMAEWLSDYISQKRRLKTPAHYLANRDLYISLLTSTRSPSITRSGSEVRYTSFGTPESFFEILRSGIYAGDKLRSDGYYSFSFGASLMVEQDMRAQTRPVLSGKFSAYRSEVFTPALSTEGAGPSVPPILLFSISTDGESSKKVERAGKENITTKYLTAAATIAALGELYASLSGKPSCTLAELSSHVYIMSPTPPNLAALLPFFEDGLTRFGNDCDTSELPILYKNLSRQDTSYETALSVNYNQYTVRRSLIGGCIDSEYERLFLSGVSVATLHNRYTDAIQALLPELHEGFSSFLLEGMAAACGGRGADDIPSLHEYTYSPIYKFPIYGSLSITMRNLYSFSSGRKYVVENVGDDFGGVFRVKTLLRMKKYPCPVLCLCRYEDAPGIITELLAAAGGTVDAGAPVYISYYKGIRCEDGPQYREFTFEPITPLYRFNEAYGSGSGDK